jgi:hypothetical protein
MITPVAPAAAPVPWLKVGEGRDEYLAANGFTVDSYTAPLVPAVLLGLRFSVPNVGGLGGALPLHDLHHVALGYGADVRGECEISAWELRAGMRNAPWLIRLFLVEFILLGLVIAPRRTLAAWRAARGCRTLFVAPLPYERLLEMTVGELRTHLGIVRPQQPGAPVG